MGVTNFIFRHTQVLYSWLMLVTYQPLYPHKNGWLCTPPLLSYQCVILLVKSHSYRGYPLVIKNSFRTGRSLFSISKSSCLSIYYNILYYTTYYILHTKYYILYTIYYILFTIYYTIYYILATILYYTIPYHTIYFTIYYTKLYTILYYTIYYTILYTILYYILYNILYYNILYTYTI